MCDGLGVELIVKKIDVPKMASERNIGIEEAARDARYLCFQDILKTGAGKSSNCILTLLPALLYAFRHRFIELSSIKRFDRCFQLLLR